MTLIVSRSRTMHPQLPILTIGGTVLKKSDDLDIFEGTFDSTMTFENHLRSVSRAASQRLDIMRNPGEYSMIDCFSGDVFRDLFCLFWRTVLQCGARLQIHSLNYYTEKSVVPVF